MDLICDLIQAYVNLYNRLIFQPRYCRYSYINQLIKLNINIQEYLLVEYLLDPIAIPRLLNLLAEINSLLSNLYFDFNSETKPKPTDDRS